MKKLLKATGILAGISAVAGVTVYALTKTDKGQAFVRATKEKALELKADVLTALGTCTEVESFEEEPVVAIYDCGTELPSEGLESVPQGLVEVLLPHSNVSEIVAGPSRQRRDRQAAVWALYEEGFDAESIATQLNLSFGTVLKDLAYGEKHGRIDY